jgi:hypothetical protein
MLVFLPLRLVLLRLLVLRLRLRLLAVGLVLGAAAPLVPLAATAAAMAALSMLVGMGLVRCLRRSGVVRRRLRLILLSCHVLHFLCDWLCVLFRFARAWFRGAAAVEAAAVNSPDSDTEETVCSSPSPHRDGRKVCVVSRWNACLKFTGP